MTDNDSNTGDSEGDAADDSVEVDIEDLVDGEDPVDDPFAELSDGIESPAEEGHESADSGSDGSAGIDGTDSADGANGTDGVEGTDENDAVLFGEPKDRGSDRESPPTADDDPSATATSSTTTSSPSASSSTTPSPSASSSSASSPTASSPTASFDPFDEIEASTAGDTSELDDAFERMDVGGVANETVWDMLDEDDGDVFAPGSDPAAAKPWDTDADGVEHVVDKRAYCQQCPHFTAPPEAACTHEGTTIVESIGFDEFRVRNCPMIDVDDPAFDPDGRE